VLNISQLDQQTVDAACTTPMDAKFRSFDALPIGLIDQLQNLFLCIASVVTNAISML